MCGRGHIARAQADLAPGQADRAPQHHVVLSRLACPDDGAWSYLKQIQEWSDQLRIVGTLMVTASPALHLEMIAFGLIGPFVSSPLKYVADSAQLFAQTGHHGGH